MHLTIEWIINRLKFFICLKQFVQYITLRNIQTIKSRYLLSFARTPISLALYWAI